MIASVSCWSCFLFANLAQVDLTPRDPSTQPVPATVEDLFKETEPYMVNVGPIDDSREAIYQRMEGE